MTEQLTQFGIAGLTLGILFFIVRYFVKAMEGKDKRIGEMTDQFRLVIENHIVHETKQWEQTTKVLSELLEAVRKMNGKKKK